ncbi:MAG TPA: O-antigen ligase family protein, partial [Bacteroidota bacterium]|nr:O-antigen ligase family protein [Bacteroidota bacterium]
METPRKSKPSLSSVALLGALFCCVLAFVPNDYDGTFIKSYLLYVFAALLAAVFISDWMKKGSVGLSYSTPSLAMLLFWVAGCISLIAASNIRLGLEGVLHLLCYVVIFHTAMVSVNSRAFISGVLALSAITAAVALLHFVLPGGSALNQFFSQLSKGSTLGNPSYFAGLLVGVFPVLAGQALDRSNTTLRRLISAALVIASLYLLASIGSRSAWIGFGASITAFGLFLLRSSKMRLAIVGLLAVAGMVFILLFQAEIIQKIENISALSGESTIARRMYIYEGAWRAFAASPVIGNGIGNFVVFLPKFRPPEYWMVKSEDIAPHAHNLVLEILSETGIVGLLLFSAVVVLSFMRILKGIKSANEGDRGLLIGLAAGLTGLLADSLFSMNLSTVPVAMMFWIFLGVGAGRLVDPNFKSVTF